MPRLSDNARQALAWVFMPLAVFFAAGHVVGLALQHLGRRLEASGDRGWVGVHRLLRAPGCDCADCRPGDREPDA